MVPYGSYDEAGSMAFGAFLAGKDWHNIFAGKPYYGFFMSIFYTPFFYFFDNPYTIYRLVCSFLALLQAIPAIITYKIMKESFLDDTYTIPAISLSIIQSYFIVVGIQAYNETGIIVLVWLIVLGMYDKFNRNNDKALFIILALTGFSNAIHERAIIILIALFFTAIASRLILNMHLFSWKSASALVFTVLLSRILTKHVQKVFWSGDSKLHNASVLDATSSFTNIDLLAQSTRQAFLAYFGGLTNTFNMILSGVFIVAIFVLITFWIKIIKNRILNISNSPLDNFLFICSLCFGLCFVGMNVGLFASWCSWISDSIKAGEINAYQYKAFTNTRYSIPFLMPLLLCTFIILIKNNISKKLLCISSIIGLAIHLYWIRHILPLIPNTGQAFFCNFFPLALRKSTESLNIDVWLRATVFFLVSLTVFNVLMFLEKKQLFIVLLSIFIVFQFYYTSFADHIYSSSVNSKKAAVAYDFLINQYTDEKSFPKSVYSFGNDSNRLQFYLNSVYIEIESLPDSTDEDVLLFWGKDLSNLDEVEGLREALANYHYIQIYKDEYVFFKGRYYNDFTSSNSEMFLFN